MSEPVTRDDIVSVFPPDKDGNTMKLHRSIVVMNVLVREGFKWDGASVPRIFYGLIFAPTEPVAQLASMYHDFCYRSPVTDCDGRHVTREIADENFRQQLIVDGCPQWKAKLAYRAVRKFGWRFWKGWEN